MPPAKGLILFAGHGGEPAETAAYLMIEGNVLTGKYMRGFAAVSAKKLAGKPDLRGLGFPCRNPSEG
jgi:hypothetical protein